MFTAGRLLILGQIFLVCCYLFVTVIVPSVTSGSLPWTDPAALSLFTVIAGTGYVTGRGGRNLNTIGGNISALAFLFFVFSSFSGAQAHCLELNTSLELQLPGGPDTVLSQGFRYGPDSNCQGFRPYRASLNSSQGIQDLLALESTAFMVSQSPELHVLMVSQGDPSNFICKWLNDGGANRGVSPDLADFTAN
jgi:hypothetical protein